jgi:hypothetical protein
MILLKTELAVKEEKEVEDKDEEEYCASEEDKGLEVVEQT